MEILNKRLSLHEFRDYLKTYDFGSVFPDKLVLHHTWRPTKASWAGEKTIAALKRHYEGKGWPAGPHLFVAEDGIWLFSPMNKDGIHAGRLNKNSIGIEIVGDYDTEVWSGSIKTNALGVIQMLLDRLGLGMNGLFFHRDASAKSLFLKSSSISCIALRLLMIILSPLLLGSRFSKIIFLAAFRVVLAPSN